MRPTVGFAVACLLPLAWSGCGGATNDAAPGADGGTADSGVPGYAVCTGAGQCVALLPGCCGVCGEPTLGDVTGVNTDRRDEFASATCKNPNPTCPECAQAEEPNLLASCEGGACEAFDIRKDPVSSCSTDADCELRYPDCCEPCAPDAARLVAISKQGEQRFHGALCKPDQACPACVPGYPAGYEAACGQDGHCEVLQRTNVCPPAQPAAGEPCSADASSSCEYGNDPRPGCRTHATCANGAWQIAVSGCPPIPGPGGGGCPATAPSGDCTNDGLVCDLGSEQYCVCASCAGGPCSLTPRWVCAGPPTTPGCPARAPALGSACTAPELVCRYGPACTAPLSAVRRCKDGAWVDEPIACPV